MTHPALILALAALAAVAPGPALAQQMEINGKRLSMSAQEQKTLGNVRATLQGRNRVVQDNALVAARRIIRSPDARHVLALYELEIGNQRGDDAIRIPALDLLIASDLTAPLNLASYLSVRGRIAFKAGDYAMADRLWTRLLEMRPGDPDVMANLAQVRVALNDPKGAIELIDRVIASQTATNRPISENLLRQRLSIANQAKLPQPAFTAALSLVRAYPSSSNWRDALVVYRQVVQPQGGLEIDLLRLMRTVGALTRDTEYLRLAQLLTHGGMAAEAKAVLTEGLALGILDSTNANTGQIIAETNRAVQRGLAGTSPLAAPDALLGSGKAAAAIPLYRAAIGKPGVDAGEANLHLAMALAATGQRAEAKAVFTALAAQGGGYAELAAFWLVWLEQQAG